jgi:hypothetical protein
MGRLQEKVTALLPLAYLFSSSQAGYPLLSPI